MGSIKSRSAGGRFVLAVLFLFLPCFFSYAQESGPSLLTAEIETLRKTLQTPGVSADSRRAASIRLARFLTLAGNLEEAAGAWFQAAAAGPEKQDATSLLEGARCLAALGQFDAAGDHVRNILLTGDIEEVLAEARYLGSQIEALKTGNGEVLDAFLTSGGYADRRPSMLYTLWRVTGEEAYRIRLETEYPSSPEARILRNPPAGKVLGAPTAMWLLLSGREGIVLGEPLIAAAGNAQESHPVAVSSGAVPAPPAAVSSPAESGSVILQTGLFSREENTTAMADRLRKAGFTAVITRRRVNGTEYWAVGVHPGEDVQGVTLALKNAGFESFPVY